MTRIAFYIDGFNLYYGCLKNTPYKWLDIRALCRRMFPEGSIVSIKYYTARIDDSFNSDLDKPIRQQTYLRALKVSQVKIVEGFFLTHKVHMNKTDGTGRVQVWKTEEKGTDVNIAAQMVDDGHANRYDIAVVISNDSDLVEPIRIVRSMLRKYVFIVTPYKYNAIELRKVASSTRRIRRSILSECQFPEIMKDSVGVFMKPKKWCQAGQHICYNHPMKKIYIIHGWEGASDRDWIGSSAAAFRTKGYEVVAPDMPNTDTPVIEEWVSHLASLVTTVDSDTYFIGHSIGCQTIMRFLQNAHINADAKAAGAIFVAGWFDLTNLETKEQEEIAKPWIETSIDTEKVRQCLGYSVVMLSNNDPWVPFEKTKKKFEEKLGSEIVVLEAAGHVTADDGFGEFPKLIEVFEAHL